MIGIYKIQNKINNKCYIGQSNNIELRFEQHKYSLKTSFSSWYPEAREESNDINDFDFTILQTCSSEELDELEAYWIDYYKSNIYGYNKKFASQGILLLTDDYILKDNFDINIIFILFEKINQKINGKSGNVRTLLLYLILQYMSGIKVLPTEQSILKSCGFTDHSRYVHARKALIEQQLISYEPFNSIKINFNEILKD